MFFSQSAPLQPARQRLCGLAGTCLAGLLLAVSAPAQSGSVQFTVQSFEEVPTSTVTAEFPSFASLYLVPFYPTSPDDGNVDLLIVQRFDSVFEGDPDVETTEENASVKIIAEYDAYDQTADQMRESGLMAFTLEDSPLSAVQGDNVIGFIRPPSKQVPSKLIGSTAATGYLTDLTGSVYWDFKAQTRRGYLIGSGATYAPAFDHEAYLTFLTNGTVAGFTGLNLPVAGADRLNWIITTPNIRALQNRTGKENTQYYGIIDRADGLSAEDLGLDTPATDDDLVPATLGQPWEFHNQAFVLRLQEIVDSDGDRIPDFLDLTDTLVKLPRIADWGAGNDWFYSGMTDDWIYSTRQTAWDFTNKFGWTWPYQASPRSNYWFYVHGSGMGWMWTSDQHFPVLYRHADGAFLQWMSTTDRTSTYYNFSDRAFETTSF